MSKLGATKPAPTGAEPAPPSRADRDPQEALHGPSRTSPLMPGSAAASFRSSEPVIQLSAAASFRSREPRLPVSAAVLWANVAQARALNPLQDLRAGQEDLEEQPALSEPDAPVLQRSAGGEAAPVASNPASIQARLTASASLPSPTAARFSAAYGHDLSDVRVHAESGLVTEVGARAFAIGRDVAFAPGAYRPGTPEGDRLIGHELAHVVQQAGGAGGGELQASGLDGVDAYEAEADRAADAALAGARVGALSPVRGKRLQGDDLPPPEPDISAAEYRQQFAVEIGQGISAYLGQLPLAAGSRFVQVSSPQPLGQAIVGATGAEIDAKLDELVGPDVVLKRIDKARPMGREQVQYAEGDVRTEDKSGSGPARWFPDVAVELATALAQVIRTSLARVVPRYIDAAVALGVAVDDASSSTRQQEPRMPRADEIVPSAPIDALTIAALVAHGRFDYQGYRKANPSERGKLGQLQPLALVWETPYKGTYWVRATVAGGAGGVATVEDVANMLFGSPARAGAIEVASPPLFGFSSASLLRPECQGALTAVGGDVHEVGDVLEAAKSGPLADELAREQGSGAPTEAANKVDVARTIDQSLVVLATIDGSGASYGMGKDPSVLGTGALRAKLTARRATILAGDDEAGLRWAGQAEAQLGVLTSIAFGMQRHAARLADMTRLEKDQQAKLGGFNLPSYIREGLHRVAAGYAAAAAASDLPQTAAAMLAGVEDDAGQLPIEFIEATLAGIQRTADDARRSKREKGGAGDTNDVGGLRAREEELKLRIANLRATLQTDPAAATVELKEIQRLISDLELEAEAVGNMDQIDAAWQAMEGSLSFWFTSQPTEDRIHALQAIGDVYHSRWHAIFQAWKTGDEDAKELAKKDLEQLRASPGLRSWFGRVQAVCKDAQVEALIGKVVAMLVITVVTAGIGDLVAAGALGWELSSGATVALVSGVEATSFTLLSQVFLDDKHGFTHIAYELASNFAMFGVMRRFQAFAEVAQLSKVAAGGGQAFLLGAITFAKADLDKYLQEGRHLNAAEVKQIALQGMAMFIAMHAIAPAMKPLYAELEGSAYAFASKLRANNRLQSALATQAKGLATSKSFAGAQKLVSGERAWLEQRLEILDEIEAQAGAEAKAAKEGKPPPPAGGVAGKIKMSAADLASLRGELKANLVKVSDGELPLLHLTPKAPGVFSCPSDRIVEVTRALGETVEVTTSADTAVRTYEIKLPDGSLARVIEVPDGHGEWIADLRAKLVPEQLTRLDAYSKNRTPREIYDHFHGDHDLAVDELSRPKGSDGPETADTYTIGDPPASGRARWKWLEDPGHWSPERRALHDRLIAQAKAEALKFAEVMAQQGGAPTVYAMRGNTAAGKSRAAKGNIPELQSAVEATSDQRSVNPDNFKVALMKEGGASLTSTQVHSESSMLASRLEAELKVLRTGDGTQPVSMMIDKRLAGVNDVNDYAKLAKGTGRKLALYDVDAPLEVSLAGVLERAPGESNPLPPYDIVGGGFTAVRSNRAAVIEQFVSDPSLGTYELYATNAKGQKVKVAEVVDGQLKTFDDPLFNEVTANPEKAEPLTASKRITEKLIQEQTAGLDPARALTVRQTLRKYLGMTWKEALDAHSLAKPPEKK